MNHKQLQDLRIKVCRDVIAQIEAEKYFGTHGVYCMLNIYLEKGPLKPQLNKKVMPTCNVCAIGATFLSLVRLNNDYNISYKSYRIDACSMRDRLNDIWNTEELRFIENLFESRGAPFVSELIGDSLNGNERLIAIMKLIIKHKGSVKGVMKKVKNKLTY